jgi:hypothetical protein
VIALKHFELGDAAAENISRSPMRWAAKKFGQPQRNMTPSRTVSLQRPATIRIRL